MRIDEKGVKHPQAIDEVTAATLYHIAGCAECSREFPKVLTKAIELGYAMSDEFQPARFVPNQDKRFVEDDLTILKEIDEKIAELINKRAERVEMIRKQNAANQEALNTSEDWFNGDLRGQPVPARYSDEADPGPSIRGRY